MTDRVERSHRIVGVLAGLFFGVNVAILGTFLDMLPVTVLAGVAIGLGTALLVPEAILAAQSGGLTPVEGSGLLGTELHPALAGLALQAAGLAVLFAGFVFESPFPAAAAGVGVFLGGVFLLDRLVPRVDPTEATTAEGTNWAGVLGVLAAFFGYKGVTAWSQHRGVAIALFVLALGAVVAGARADGYV